MWGILSIQLVSFFFILKLVALAGLEPARPSRQGFLRPPCATISSQGQNCFILLSPLGGNIIVSLSELFTVGPPGIQVCAVPENVQCITVRHITPVIFEIVYLFTEEKRTNVFEVVRDSGECYGRRIPSLPRNALMDAARLSWNFVYHGSGNTLPPKKGKSSKYFEKFQFFILPPKKLMILPFLTHLLRFCVIKLRFYTESR